MSEENTEGRPGGAAAVSGFYTSTQRCGMPRRTTYEDEVLAMGGNENASSSI